LSPCATRVPRLTRVSEGNPFRRLLVRSKAVEFAEVFAALCHMGIRVREVPAATRGRHKVLRGCLTRKW